MRSMLAAVESLVAPRSGPVSRFEIDTPSAVAMVRGTHFRVRIAAPGFTGRTRVASHRLVYDALRPFLDAGLHALAIEILPRSAPGA